MRAIIFAGPTISAVEIRRILDADCRGPAAQGEVYRAACERPAAIGIVDGYFELQPAVWHKEILWAMSEGIHVFGSASMGALRAAELEAFGMAGVGSIFEAFRDGILEDDDEVAVAHAGPDHGYRQGSDAMVDIRATLRKAAREGMIDASAAAAAESFAKGLFYADRSYAALFDCVPEMRPLRQWLMANAVRQKHDDAVAMLGAIRDLLASCPGPKQVDFVFQESLWWEALCHQEGGTGAAVADLEVLAELKRSPAQYQRAKWGALGWWLAEREARRNGDSPLAADVVDGAEEFCRARGIGGAQALFAWLRANHCQRHGLDLILRSAALAAREQRSVGGDILPFLLRYLRWTGEYEELLHRSAQASRGSHPTG